MPLKVDYRDDIFAGTRKYQQIKNDDGTYSFVDVTVYTQDGDLFGANDINSANREINKLERLLTATLTAAGWGNTAPYMQSVSIAGVSATDIPIIGISIAEGTAPDQVKAQNKAWGCVDRAVTGNGTITFYCYNKKPEVNFSVNVKGV